MASIIFPTAYLPPISWWVHALHFQEIQIEVHETFPKQTYRNRCLIFSSAGLLPLSIPVKKVFGTHTPTSEIRIDNSRNWQLVHWRSIESCYNKTPYFLYYKDIFSPYYHSAFDRLVDFNSLLLKVCFDLLKIDTVKVSETTDYVRRRQYPEFRELIHPKLLAKETGIIGFPRYFQAFEPMHGFKENLSIIDLLFNVGPETAAYLREVRLRNFNEQNATLRGNQP